MPHELMFKYKEESRPPEKLVGDYQVQLFDTVNPIAIDLGCSIGAFTLGYSHVFDTIYSIDACYTNCRILENNLRKNHVKNCLPFHFAASNVTGELCKLYGRTSSPYNNISICENTIFKSGLDIRGTKDFAESKLTDEHDSHYAMTISFPDMLKFLGVKKIHFLKVDIEGAEYDFLYGQDLSMVDVLAIEVHFSKNSQSKKLVDYLSQTFDIAPSREGTHRELTCTNSKFKGKESTHYKSTLEAETIDCYYRG